MIEIARIIEGVFSSILFGGKSKKPKPIVKWAPPGENIPIRCRKCGAVFVTANINYIGYSRIFIGDNFQKCEFCVRSNHSISLLCPDREVYKEEIWE